MAPSTQQSRWIGNDGSHIVGTRLGKTKYHLTESGGGGGGRFELLKDVLMKCTWFYPNAIRSVDTLRTKEMGLEKVIKWIDVASC